MTALKKIEDYDPYRGGMFAWLSCIWSLLSVRQGHETNKVIGAGLVWPSLFSAPPGNISSDYTKIKPSKKQVDLDRLNRLQSLGFFELILTRISQVIRDD